MSLINSTAIPSGASAYEIEQSLRFEDGSSTTLTRTPASSGNCKTWTFSVWFKLGNLTGASERILQIEPGNAGVYVTSTGQIGWVDVSASNFVMNSDRLLRDPSAWYHLVLAFDSTQSTDSNRLKAWLNGELIAFTNESGYDSYPSLNQDGRINSERKHIIGGYRETSQLWDGYLAEVNFIDGLAKSQADFGETGDYGEWKPIEYSGSYGTNGFYLPFKQDYTVEGFSTVLYKGNGGTQYIGGTGFQPDFSWIKRRNSAQAHSLIDSVRGGNKMLESQSNGAEASLSGGMAFKPDGFILDQTGGWNEGNADGDSYVAWNWDMSNPASNVGNTVIQFDNSDDSIDFELGTALGTGNFTVEYWTYIDSLQNFDTFFSTTRGSTGFNIGTDANGMAVWYRGSRLLESASGTYVAGNWYHTAYVRNGTTLKVYVNGVEKDSTTDSNNYSELTSSIGSLDSAGEFGGIKLDAFRISNVARYTSNNFESPQARFTSDSNTLCLINSPTNVGGTIVDSSSASLSLSLTGTSVDVSSLAKPAYPNTDGSITSLVRANPTYGQSIVSYTGTGANATVGHGLSSAPEMIITKNRDSAIDSVVYHSGTSANPQNEALSLSSTSNNSDYHWWNDTAPTSSVFSLGNANTNNSSAKFIAYCFHSVTGYSKFGSYTGDASTDGSLSVTTGFAPAFLMVKRTNSTGGWVMVDNTRNPSNPINKYSQANTTDTEASGSLFNFTSTGFNLLANLADINSNGGTYIYMAFADKREYAYWLDQSGNNNDWTSNNLTESDISVDSPTNNFATFNPVSTTNSNITYSEGNLKYVQTGQWLMGMCTHLIQSGKWYVEYLVADNTNFGLGLCVPNSAMYGYANTANQGWFGKANGGFGFQQNGSGTGEPLLINNTSTARSSYGANTSVGDILQMAYDADTGKLWFGLNNTYSASGNPSAGSNEGTTIASADRGNLIVSVSMENCNGILNFGQDSSFAGNKTPQGNQDGNDIGDFYYAPPTGFLALCTSNLPDVAVVPSEHFNPVIYTGNATARSITGVGFQPDFVWIKNRAAAESHTIYDVLRGVGIRLGSDYTDGDDNRGSYGLTAFGSDGFTIGTGGELNGNNQAIVSWNWKANGSGSSNTAGSINSTVSANVDAGFSIVSYVGNTTAGATVGHGLSSAPEMMIIKNRDRAYDWIVWHDTLADDYHLRLNGTHAAINSSTRFNSTDPSSTVFTLGSQDDTNGVSGANDDLIAYCFHSVDGYSKMGSYTGNGSTTNGPFVYTGFRPAFIMVKRTDGAGHWEIHDTARDVNNPSGLRLMPNYTSAESSSGAWDIVSNGFKVNTDHGSINNSGSPMIYLAFAETPFKYSNAR